MGTMGGGGALMRTVGGGAAAGLIAIAGAGAPIDWRAFVYDMRIHKHAASTHPIPSDAYA